MVRADGEGPEFGRRAPGLLLGIPVSLRGLGKAQSSESASFPVASPSWFVAIVTVLSDFLGQFYMSCSLIIAHMILDIKHQNINSM